MSVRAIAKLTGLSPSGVSAALRHSPKIPEATRKRVREAARRAGHLPNAKLAEAMDRLRQARNPRSGARFAVMSFYDEAKPWESSRHLARIYDGMTQRAATLGAALEPLWLRQPGMSHRRFCSILDARGIEGLLCFGNPNLEAEFPPEFDRYAVVTEGLSIKTPLHRVVSHDYNDIWRALHRVHASGYRRPGLVIGGYEEARSSHAYRCGYLGWSQLTLGALAIPALHLDQVEEAPLLAWLDRHRPDAIIFVDRYETLEKFAAVLRRRGIRVPGELGVAVISQIVEGTGFSGLQENQQAMGARSVELLAARIMNRDFGIPVQPRIEMVERVWIDGQTLRPLLRRREPSGPGRPADSYT